MPGLVVFLHGQSGNQNTWGAVPDFMQKSPLGNDFDVFTPKYSASFWTPSKIEFSADQILTQLQTSYGNHDPIYLVGYSLGGLIAREICLKLLVDGPDAFLNKIPACITLGTPLEGARIGNFIVRKTPLISKKLRQIAVPKFAFDRYRQAIRIAKKRKVGRPKQLHIQIEDDYVIKQHVKDHFTEDDFAAGAIPGTHRHFAELNKDASYVADVLLQQIRTIYNAASRPNIRPSDPVAQPDLPDRLILISCSHGKREGGTSPFEGPSPAGWLPQPVLRQRIISKRTYIYGLLGNAKLFDGFERGGNRANQPSNMTLKFGPDLGGISVVGDEGKYLAASHRYNGRSYAPVRHEAWQKIPENKGTVRVLIMSGLYGLIEPDEYIQNYDVHLTDTNDNGISVSAVWSELFTQSIDTYIRHAYRGRKVNIFNLLCDRHYVDAVQWHALSTDCSVYHLASPTLEDVGLLPVAGLLLNAFLLDPRKLEEVDRDQKKYALSDFGAPPAGMADVEILFESRVGISKSREK